MVGAGVDRLENPRKDLQTLTLSETINGRIDDPGEVDRYRIVLTGEPCALRIVAAECGSWLDSVLRVRDSRGVLVAESDDSASLDEAESATNPDSMLELPTDARGTFTVEVTDRYGKGGSEYAYRLSAAGSFPDFRITIDPRLATELVSSKEVPPNGVLPLATGTAARIPLRVKRRGRTGPITIRLEGLPPGTHVDPVVARRFRPTLEPTVMGAEVELEVKVDPGLADRQGRFRVIGTAIGEDGQTRTRRGECRLPIGAVAPAGGPPPVWRSATSLPFRVYTGKDNP